MCLLAIVHFHSTCIHVLQHTVMHVYMHSNIHANNFTKVVDYVLFLFEYIFSLYYIPTLTV